MHRFLVLLVASLLLCPPALPSARAIAVVARSFDELVTRADTVFKGTVTAKTSRWAGQGDRRHIVTLVTFQVQETYKGSSAPEQTLRFLGGEVDGEAMTVPDMPQFEVGQRAVLFVVDNGKRYCPLVGVTQGRFRVTRDASTGRERVFTDDESPVVSTAEIGQVDASGVPRLRRYAHTGAQALPAEDFRAEILGKVAALPR